jgi:hypothetical protein
MKKIAFCFLIYDCINHEEIWNIFFNNIDPNKYTIYIHYKFNKPLRYFEKYKLENCIHTNDDDYTIPLACNLLFREAYIDADNYKFQILSGSCIPLKSFDYIYNKLTTDNYGYLNGCTSINYFPNCDCLFEIINKKYISRADNWFIFNRILVRKLCFDKDNIIIKYYKNIKSPAEYFYFTYIKVLNLDKEVILSGYNKIGQTIFTNNDTLDYKYKSNSGIKTYNNITNEELTYLINNTPLYGRKFTDNCSTSFINKTYINCITSKL